MRYHGFRCFLMCYHASLGLSDRLSSVFEVITWVIMRFRFCQRGYDPLSTLFYGLLSSVFWVIKWIIMRFLCYVNQFYSIGVCIKSQHVSPITLEIPSECNCYLSTFVNVHFPNIILPCNLKDSELF